MELPLTPGTFWSVREYMFPMIWAAILRVSVDRSWKALCTMGMMRAREGASMKWTNLVSSSVWRHVWVFLDGSVRASSRMGVIAGRGRPSDMELNSDRSRSLTQDLRVADDGADLAEGLLPRVLDLHVGVGQHLR